MMSNERKETLGYVGVDSGQLMIIDPCYMSGKDMDEGEVIGLKFWGRDAETLANHLIENGIHEVEGEYPYTIKADNENIKYISNEISTIAKNNEWLVVSSPLTNSIYDSICDITNNENQGGEVDLGVAFSSGLGDGSYEVVATYKELAGWGERITKVEIILIDDEDMEI